MQSSDGRRCRVWASIPRTNAEVAFETVLPWQRLGCKLSSRRVQHELIFLSFFLIFI
jgi:hypothetical protein